MGRPPTEGGKPAFLPRDRIKELRRVRAGDLVPHPKNWRSHGAAQRSALEGVLQEVGYADALLVRELDDGRLQLIDGHLRAETTPEAEAPVLVLDVDEAEAELVLATHDPLGELAGRNEAAASELAATIEERSEGLAELLRAASETPAIDWKEREEIELPELYQVVVECSDETEQREVFEQMRKAGRKCRVLVM